MLKPDSTLVQKVYFHSQTQAVKAGQYIGAKSSQTQAHHLFAVFTDRDIFPAKIHFTFHQGQ